MYLERFRTISLYSLDHQWQFAVSHFSLFQFYVTFKIFAPFLTVSVNVCPPPLFLTAYEQLFSVLKNENIRKQTTPRFEKRVLSTVSGFSQFCIAITFKILFLFFSRTVAFCNSVCFIKSNKLGKRLENVWHKWRWKRIIASWSSCRYKKIIAQIVFLFTCN